MKVAIVDTTDCYTSPSETAPPLEKDFRGTMATA